MYGSAPSSSDIDPDGRASGEADSARLVRAAHIGVLVVEDDPTLREAIQGYLELEGYEPIAVATLLDARKQLVARAPCVLVLDLTLDGEFGADLLIELADEEVAPATVIVSAFPLAQLVGDRFGVEVLRKPFDLDALRDAVLKAATEGRRPRPPQ